MTVFWKSHKSPTRVNNMEFTIAVYDYFLVGISIDDIYNLDIVSLAYRVVL